MASRSPGPESKPKGRGRARGRAAGKQPLRSPGSESREGQTFYKRTESVRMNGGLITGSDYRFPYTYGRRLLNINA